MPYSKKLWLSAGAVVLAVIIVVAVIRLRSDEVQRATLFSKPEEIVAATDAVDPDELPELDLIIEEQEIEETSSPTPSPQPPAPIPTPTLTLLEQEIVDAAEREVRERKLREQLRLQEQRQEMAERYKAVATEQGEHLRYVLGCLRQLSEGQVSSEERKTFLDDYLRESKSLGERRDPLKGFGSDDKVEKVDNLIEQIKSRMDLLVARLERGDTQIPAEEVEKLEADIELLDNALTGLDLESE